MVRSDRYVIGGLSDKDDNLGQTHYYLPSPRSFVTLKFICPIEIFSPTRAVPSPPSPAGIFIKGSDVPIKANGP